MKKRDAIVYLTLNSFFVILFIIASLFLIHLSNKADRFSRFILSSEQKYYETQDPDILRQFAISNDKQFADYVDFQGGILKEVSFVCAMLSLFFAMNVYFIYKAERSNNIVETTAVNGGVSR